MDRLEMKEGGTGGRVVLYTIPGQCPLCDEARETLLREAIEFSEVDIRKDRALLRAFKLEIPVVTVDGRKEFIGRVEPKRLKNLLGKPPSRDPA